MKRTISILCLVALISGCSMKSKEEQQQRNEHLSSLYKQIGIYDNPYGLPEPLQKTCHERIKQFYIAKYKNPETYVVSEKFAPMNFANATIYDYSQPISQRMGYDVTNTLAFMTEYKGKTALGLNWPQRFVCVVQATDGYLHYKSVMPEDNFKKLWAIDPDTPMAWIQD